MDEWQQVYAVVVRYLDGIDDHDFAAVATCFAQDAHAAYAGRGEFAGRDAIVAFLTEAHTAPKSSHILGGVRIEIDGDRATADAQVVAFLVDGGVARIRGLRYSDRLERCAGSWQITDRVHSLGWAATAEAEQQATPSDVPGR